MDKMILDFETGRVTLVSEMGYTVQTVPDLTDRKEAIMEASGAIALDEMPEMQGLIEKFRSGEIDEEEFIEKTKETASDALKSRYHERLN